MKLSIIIPFYQNQKNLSNCLKSLSNQTVFSLYDKNEVEIIIINDGDDSFIWDNEIIHYSLFIIHYFKILHSGAPAARNFGFQKSTGEYIFFCDSDVIFLKNNALEKMIKILEENKDKAFCYSRFKFGLKKFPCQEFNIDDLKKNNYISTMSLIRHEWLEKVGEKPWDENIKKFQDWDLWLSIIEKGGNGIFIPEYFWKAKAGGMSKWLPRLFYKVFKNSKNVREYEEAKSIVIKKHNL
jgi:glycosyltransferase involved in cell wall biosynthesis